MSLLPHSPAARHFCLFFAAALACLVSLVGIARIPKGPGDYISEKKRMGYKDMCMTFVYYALEAGFARSAAPGPSYPAIRITRHLLIIVNTSASALTPVIPWKMRGAGWNGWMATASVMFAVVAGCHCVLLARTVADVVPARLRRQGEEAPSKPSSDEEKGD